MNDETRKLTITIAAAIFAARALALADWDGKRSPRLVASVYDAVEKAKFLVSTIDGKS